ncbi:amidohydrolase family protein [Porticoccaceae bacterium]|nr:amidohydrolase family protein [Porticoccaceae bacterium]
MKIKMPNHFITFKVIVVFIVINTLSGVAQANTAKSTTVVITGATVIDIDTGVKTVMDIVIKNDRISTLIPHNTTQQSDTISLGATVIDARGQYAIPGLWDMHVHLTFVPELEDRILPLFIANGVTSVRDMGGPLDDIMAFHQRANQPLTITPQRWLAGPLVDGSPPRFDGKRLKPAMSMAVDTPEEAIALVDKLAEAGVHLIKPYAMLRPDVLAAVVKRAHYHGLPVDGHIPLRSTTLEALAAGMDGVEHLTGMESDCTHNPEALRAERVAILNANADDVAKVYNTMNEALANQVAKQCAKLIQTFVEQGTWHTPTLSVFSFITNPSVDAFQYLPRTIREQRLQRIEGFKKQPVQVQYKNKHQWNMDTVRKMHRAGVEFLAGTDTAHLLIPGFSLHDELKLLVQAGLSPLDALQSATLNPAKFFGIDNEQGSIEAGKIADIVLLDADPLADINHSRSINTVIAQGRVFDRQTLDKLLADLVEK